MTETRLGGDLLMVSSRELFEACPPAMAVAAIESALRSGVEPATTPGRISLAAENGTFLLMPSGDGGDSLGLKVVTVAPGNARRGHPQVQACYLLYDHETLTLRAILDGTALTALRTPAVSVAAIRPHLNRHPDGMRLVIVGAGAQARAHARAFRAVTPAKSLHYLVRDPARAPHEESAQVALLGSAAADQALRAADVVVCATSARYPLFPSDLLRDNVAVVAVGAYKPDVREIDADLCRRATVVVEDSATALREAGDVVLAVAEGALSTDDLIPLREVVTGSVTAPPDRPLFFKSVGMAWEDLVVAETILAGRST